MKKPENRLRKFGEKKKDGTLAANQGRLGPLTFDARRKFLNEILDVQEIINLEARKLNRPVISLINDEEFWRINTLIQLKTYPDGWTGDEMRGDEMTDKILRDGTIQPWMFEEEVIVL